MNIQQGRNVVALLQQEPFYYRNFGIWWWHVKASLKRLGFTRDQLPHLGNAVDESVSEYYEDLSDKDLDDIAFTHQFDHTFADYNNNKSFTPTGEMYFICDDDVE